MTTLETRLDRLETLQHMAQVRHARAQQDLPRQPDQEVQHFRVEDKHFPKAILTLTGNGDPSAEDWTNDVHPDPC